MTPEERKAYSDLFERTAERYAKGEKPPRDHFSLAATAAIENARVIDSEADGSIVPADPWELME
jgi:hypothetical protein